MAVRAHDVIAIDAQDSSRIRVVEWQGLLNGDVGDWLQIPFWGDKTVQAYGTFGAGGSVAIEGSGVLAVNNPAGNQIDSLHNPAVSIIALADVVGSRIQAVLENPLCIRPHVTAGDGTTSLTVVLTLRRS